MTVFLWVIFFLIVILVLSYFNVYLLVSSLIIAIYLALLTVFFNYNVTTLCFDGVFLVFAVVLNIRPLRRLFFSNLIFRLIKKSLPPLSLTEEQALKAGTVGFEGELFCGKPSFKKMLELKPVQLSKEERDFLSGPTEELCHILDDYKISKDGDLPPEVWQFIKNKGFLSMIIPKVYGGKEFSAWAHASVIVKVGSRNFPAAISIGVPNSLGPAELLLRYGTEKQKDYYLPRLASGEEIPCFALTGPRAGSDAASIPDFGIVCHGKFNGQDVLGIRLNWDKRYITLAPIATLIGLAFKLRDPDHLLSPEEEIGITCALIPRDLPGIIIGKRHNPLNIVFQNGPTTGTDVFIPLDYVIGGQRMIGHGWRMLMECLSVGRAITLPSTGTSAAMVSALLSGCYARVRHQFGLPIGRFEGVKESLGQIGGDAYLNMAILRFVVAGVDQGQQPAVASAIVKYHTTERARLAINRAMDIHGGKGICLGPKNYLISLYRGAPVTITVEGANILTRNMIIFGQGAMRCHPYLFLEIDAVRQDKRNNFDKLLFKHIGYFLRNKSRTWIYAIGGGCIVPLPKSLVKRHFLHLSRYSAAFAWLADVVLLELGGTLKRKEGISARLGDVFSYLYMASAVLKRFHDEGQPKNDLPIINYICENLFYDIEQKIFEILENLPNRFVALMLCCTIFPLGRRRKKPKDHTLYKIAELMQYPNESFERLTEGIFKSKIKNNPLAFLEEALKKTVLAEELEKRVYRAQKKNLIRGLSEEDLVNDAHKKGIISPKEAEQLIELVRMREEIIAVDEFSSIPS